MTAARSVVLDYRLERPNSWGDSRLLPCWREAWMGALRQACGARANAGFSATIFRVLGELPAL